MEVLFRHAICAMTAWRVECKVGRLCELIRNDTKLICLCSKFVCWCGETSKKKSGHSEIRTSGVSLGHWPKLEKFSTPTSL